MTSFRIFPRIAGWLAVALLAAATTCLAGENNADPNDKLMNKGIDILTSLLEKKLEGKPMPKPLPKVLTQIPPKQETVNGEATQIPPKQENPDDKVTDYIRKNLTTFINFAKNETPVQGLTDYMFNSLGEKEFENLQNYLTINGLEKILAQFPELSLYNNWVSELIDDIKGYFDQTQEEKTDELETNDKPAETELHSGN